MATFFIGLIILVVGGFAYGKICENVFKPDDRKTPALKLQDGVDYVPMKKWKNSLINLLNIAGTGPVLGPIQGILFGPIAFITIPIGCVLAGAMHDYFAGMISLRNDGAQMPALVRKFGGNKIYQFYMVFCNLLMLLVGAVFVYTPGDIAATQVFGFSGKPDDYTTWIIYGVIFAYYIVATLFPIDAIIGRIYPVFGALLLISAVGIFIGLFTGGYTLDNVTTANMFGAHPAGTPFIPIFFITVACGILSGFHATQTSIIARSVPSEKDGRTTFYNMMILEGFIAMCWAAGAMAVMNKGLADAKTPATAIVGIASRDMLGNVGGILAILGVIVLPITSGDTALRGMRLMIAEYLHIDQGPKANRLKVSVPIFVLCGALLVWAKFSPNGFTILWRYFAWMNQTLAIFALGLATIYLIAKGHTKAPFIPLLPGMFYCFITTSFLLNAKIGFNIPMTFALILGGVLSILYSVWVFRQGNKYKRDKIAVEEAPVYK